VRVAAAFSAAFIFPNECLPMPMSGYTCSFNLVPVWRARHFLPGHRQNIPHKPLKNNKNSAPDLLARSVQGPEAVWDVNRRRCGLEIWE